MKCRMRWGVLSFQKDQHDFQSSVAEALESSLEGWIWWMQGREADISGEWNLGGKAGPCLAVAR